MLEQVNMTMSARHIRESLSKIDEIFGRQHGSPKDRMIARFELADGLGLSGIDPIEISAEEFDSVYRTGAYTRIYGEQAGRPHVQEVGLFVLAPNGDYYEKLGEPAKAYFRWPVNRQSGYAPPKEDTM